MKSNIWYVSKYANISWYGADTRQACLCREFAKNGHNVRLVTSNSSHLYNSLPVFKARYKNMDYDGFRVTWINSPKYSNSVSKVRFISWLLFEIFVCLMAFRRNHEKPDVIIVSSLSILSVFSGCFYKYFFGAKFVFEIRDIWPQSLVDLKGISPKNPLIWVLSKIERLGYRYSDSIVGTMPGLTDHVESEVGLGCKVISIPHGVNLDFYRESQKELSDDFIRLYIPKNKFIITYAGTMGHANALEYIIDAAKKIGEDKSNDVHFLFLGSGNVRERLIQQAKGLDNVTFAPAVMKDQVKAVLDLSDVLVASVRDEKIYRFGISLNKFIDYMYARKPIICMFSGYPSLINEANCGEFTPSEDVDSFVIAINKYRNMSSDKLDSLGENGRQYLEEQRSYKTLGLKFMKLFE